MYSIKIGNRYLFATIFTYILMTILLTAYFSSGQPDLTTVQLLVLSQWGMVFLPILVYFMVTKQPFISTGLFRRIKLLNIVLSVMLAGLILPTLNLINVVSQLFVKSAVNDLITEVAKLPFWFGTLLIAVTPAVLEEIAMRSIIINNYRSKRVLTTCLFSGFFFGMFHMNLNQFFYAFAMGVVMCLVVHLTGSIFSSMIIHFVINFIGVLMAELLPLIEKFYQKVDPELAEQFNEQMAAGTDPSTIMSAIIALLGVNLFSIPLAGLIIFALMKYNKKMNIFKDRLTTHQVLGLTTNEVTDSETIFTPALILAITCFGIFVTLNEIVMPLLL